MLIFHWRKSLIYLQGNTKPQHFEILLISKKGCFRRTRKSKRIVKIPCIVIKNINLIRYSLILCMFRIHGLKLKPLLTIINKFELFQTLNLISALILFFSSNRILPSVARSHQAFTATSFQIDGYFSTFHGHSGYFTVQPHIKSKNVFI
jgi:hypothetical protein